MYKDAQKIAELLNVNLPKPTDDQIQEAIRLIEKRFEDKGINDYVNKPVKEGYTKAIEVLNSGKLDYKGLITVQGRAIAAIAFDYLNGECSQEVLVNVPLKPQF